MRLKKDVDAALDQQMTHSSSSYESRSLPSSPPTLTQRDSGGDEMPSPTLPYISGIPSTERPKTPATAQRRMYQQYLDGSFSVYDDSVPARLQPQTPAELSRGNHLNEHNAAYTAPPGMVRTPLTSAPYGHARRLPSGDMSPTTRALLIRERRQREFMRSARLEGLRIRRTRNEGPRGTNGSHGPEQFSNLWREDLGQDSVGDENFEDISAMPDLGVIRVISGNRRGP